MKCLHAASEVAGFAKTGGLADVVGSLPTALQARGIDCAVVMPLYRACRSGKQPITPTEHRFRIPMGNRMMEGRLWRSTLADANVPVYLIEQADYFDRDNPAAKRGIYQFADGSGDLIDYPDNSPRFGFFSRAILEAIRLLDFWPDVLHLHDWQTGMTGVFLREIYQQFGKPDLRHRYGRIRTFFTIHNLAYQGTFWAYDVPMLGLPWSVFTSDKVEFYGKLNFLKAGLVYADRLTTVSPTYAREIQTTLFGCGLHGVLMQRSRDLHGIVNGIDDRVWDPALDPLIAATYDAATLADGKACCKAALQKEFGLALEPGTPLLGIVSRLAAQKGLDLVEKIAPDLLRQEVQVIVLGAGEKVYADMLAALREEYPQRVGLHLGYDEAIAHRIEAGADVFLMPSRYEPCGLNQLFSLKYGTIPVVHATGGLVDTVVDGETGFVFRPFTPEAFLGAIARCLTIHRDDPASWRRMQQTAMAQDWSWRRSAAEYERLYRQVLQEF